MMDEVIAEFIRRTFLKCSLAQMMPLLKAWGFLTDRQLETLTMRGKERLIQQILQFCEEVPASGDNAAALDLVFNHLRCNNKHWYVYQMSKTPDEETEFFDMADFKRQFKKNLKSVANVTVHFKEFDNAQWIRIAWGTHSKRPNQYSPTFVVYHSQTPYVFITGLRRSCRAYLCQALVIATKYSQIQEMDLSSRCLDSLKQIVFKRYHQAFQTHYPKHSKETKAAPEPVDPRVTFENKKEKERIQNWTKEVFGEGPQPKLEFAQYKLETMFRDPSDNDTLSHKEDPFRCVVKFSSPHLLESLKLLAPSGIAEAPLSQLLTCIPSKARNHFKIGEKRIVPSMAKPGS